MADRYSPRQMSYPSPFPGTDPTMRTYGDPLLGPPASSTETFGSPATGVEQKHLMGDQLARTVSASRGPLSPMDAVSHATDVLNNHINNLHWELGAM